MIEMVLYGLPKGATERYEEVLLLTHGTPERIERAKELARRDGFHSFRVAKIDLSKVPNFKGTVRKGGDAMNQSKPVVNGETEWEKLSPHEKFEVINNLMLGSVKADKEHWSKQKFRDLPFVVQNFMSSRAAYSRDRAYFPATDKTLADLNAANRKMHAQDSGELERPGSGRHKEFAEKVLHSFKNAVAEGDRRNTWYDLYDHLKVNHGGSEIPDQDLNKILQELKKMYVPAKDATFPEQAKLDQLERKNEEGKLTRAEIEEYRSLQAAAGSWSRHEEMAFRKSGLTMLQWAKLSKSEQQRRVDQYQRESK